MRTTGERRRGVIAVAVAVGVLALAGGLLAVRALRGGDGAAKDGAPDAAVVARVSPADVDAALTAARADLTAGQYERAEGGARQAIALATTAAGASSAGAGRGWAVLGEALEGQGHWPEAHDALAKAVRILEASGGDGPELAAVLLALAISEQGTGHHEDSVISIERAVDLLRAAGDGKRHELALALVAEGRALVALGHPDDARERLDEAIALFEKLDDHDVTRGLALIERGDLARGAGDCGAAVPDYQRAESLFTNDRGANDPYNLYALGPLGHCLLELGTGAKALDVLERAHALPAGGGMEDVLAVQVRFDRGRALVETRRDRKGGLAEARAARAQMDTVPGAKGLAATADAWLAKQP